MLKASAAVASLAALLLSSVLLVSPAAAFRVPSALPRPAAAAAATTTSSSSSSTSLRMAQQSPDSADRRAAALGQLGVLCAGAWLAVPRPAQAAKKITNLEEARALGEKRMEEIERSKGPLIKVRDGVRYREELVGKGDAFEKGDLVKIRFQVYKGNGDYMFSTGYGREFQQDVGDTYDFTMGRPNSVPLGVAIGMEGMRVGGKRKILVPPELGWSSSGGFPEPQTFSGKRKLLNNINQQLQMEVELIRVKKRGGSNSSSKAAAAGAAAAAAE